MVVHESRLASPTTVKRKTDARAVKGRYLSSAGLACTKDACRKTPKMSRPTTTTLRSAMLLEAALASGVLRTAELVGRQDARRQPRERVDDQDHQRRGGGTAGLHTVVSMKLSSSTGTLLGHGPFPGAALGRSRRCCDAMRATNASSRHASLCQGRAWYLIACLQPNRHASRRPRRRTTPTGTRIWNGGNGIPSW